jgi:hypothetical protein
MDHAAGHFPGFKTEGAASSRERIIPGDEKMFALEAIDSFTFQMAPTR